MTDPSGAADVGAAGAAATEPAEPAAAEVPWRKLDRRTVLVTALRVAGIAVAAAIPAAFGLGNRLPVWLVVLIVPAAGMVAIGVAAAVDDLRWRKTSYRVLPERVQLRTGIVVRNRRSLARERIRSVDLTAGLLLRFFGLVNVKIGTGEQTGTGQSSLNLNPVRRVEAERLRRALLEHAREEPDSAARADGLLGELDLAWVRYAPMSLLTPMLGAAAFGVVLQISEWLGVQEGVVTWILDRLREMSLPAAILTVLGSGLVVGVVASSFVFVEMWWQFRLEREPGGTLRVRRGLLTTRSISLEERRLRGVEVVEPLGNRMLGAARVDAVATGLVQQKPNERTDHKTLLPPAPRWNADRVAAAVLREPVSPTESVRLRPHPRAARGRRLRWALATAAVPVVILLVLGLTLSVTPLLHLAWIVAVPLVPIAVVLAIDAYHNLGHGLTGDYLVVRSGALRRGTVALQRRGVIGWTARQSVFQRRKGLITLTATTAAGSGAYSAHDVGESEGLAFAETAVPDLFGPFLQRTS